MWRNRPNLFLFPRFPFVILQQPLAGPHRLRLHHFAIWTGSVHESGVSRETTPALHTHQTYVSRETSHPALRRPQQPATFHVKHWETDLNTRETQPGLTSHNRQPDQPTLWGIGEHETGWQTLSQFSAYLYAPHPSLEISHMDSKEYAG